MLSTLSGEITKIMCIISNQSVVVYLFPMAHPLTLHEMVVVVVGQNHNPSILNPDFLWRNHIVPEEVKLADDEPAFSSPMVSQCTFKNGLRIVSEPNRITFAEKNPAESNGLGCDAARTYLRVVPLVNYTATGINFFGSFPTLSSKSALRDMIRTGEWGRFEDVLPSAEIQLTYPLAGRIVNLTIADEKSDDSQSEQKINVSGNFHRDIRANSGESHQVAIAMVSDWENDLECFERLIENLSKGT